MAEVAGNSIAILGWGSLIWDAREQFKFFEEQHGPWISDGPRIKIEFSRISQSRACALTLVIDSTNGQEAQVSYCLSNRKELDAAIVDLKKREGCPRSKIGYISLNDSSRHCRDKTAEECIEKWARSKAIERVVWTDLESNFLEKTNVEFTADNAVAHIRSLPDEGKRKAAEYVLNAPNYVQTPLRTRLMSEHWFC